MTLHDQHLQRLLSGEDSSLSHASIAKIIGTGVALGIVHVLTGPDHLSALAAMTTGSSWRAFALGIRWGCGHSIGLIIMALIFFAAGQSINLNEVGGYLNYVVGAFMIGLGFWTVVHVKRKYCAQLKEAQLAVLCTSQRSSGHNTNGGQQTLTLAHMSERAPSTGGERPQQQRVDVVHHQHQASPTTSFQLFTTDADGAEDKSDCAFHDLELEEKDASMANNKKKSCCSAPNMSNPTTQRIAALLVGIVHGIAGPGGILGVLPAVVMDDWGKSVAYLGSFCASSIFIMGVFAALYGEVTGRLSRNSNVLELRIGLFSASFSVIVGVAWIVLQATGTMDDVFE